MAAETAEEAAATAEEAAATAEDAASAAEDAAAAAAEAESELLDMATLRTTRFRHTKLENDGLRGGVDTQCTIAEAVEEKLNIAQRRRDHRLCTTPSGVLSIFELRRIGNMEIISNEKRMTSIASSSPTPSMPLIDMTEYNVTRAEHHARVL